MQGMWIEAKAWGRGRARTRPLAMGPGAKADRARARARAKSGTKARWAKALQYHTLTVRSAPPEISFLELDCAIATTVVTSLLWPLSVSTHAAVLVHQILMVVSSLALLPVLGTHPSA